MPYMCCSFFEIQRPGLDTRLGSLNLSDLHGQLTTIAVYIYRIGAI